MYGDEHRGIRGLLLIYLIYIVISALVLMLELSQNRINGIIFMPVLVIHLLLVVTMILKLRIFRKLVRMWLFILALLGVAGLTGGIIYHGAALIKLSAISLVFNGLWLLYFSISSRVRNTFI